MQHRQGKYEVMIMVYLINYFTDIKCISPKIQNWLDNLIQVPPYGVVVNNYKEIKIVVFKNLVNFRKLLNKETSFILVSGGVATPLELDKVKWSNKLKD